MPLRLFDSPMSSNSLRVRFALAELGVAYDRVHVPLARPRPAALLEVNPRGLVPVLDDDGFVLTESATILRYLATREGRDDLYPAAPRDRARVDELLDRLGTGLRAAFFRVEAPALGFVAGQGWDARPRDPVAARAAEAEVASDVAVLESVVGPRFAVLDRFTIADMALAPVLFRTLHTGMSLDPYPRLASLRETVLHHPAWGPADPVL